MSGNFQLASDLFDNWRDDVYSGKPPMLYPIGKGDLAQVELGPSLVTLFGGAPGAGKTAFIMQAVCDALRMTPSLKACICNIEMKPATLLERQLARLSGVDLTAIRHRKFEPEHADRLDRAMRTLESIADRLCFVRPPFDLANVAAVADEFDAGLLVFDYIQRIKPPGEYGDKRGSVDACMNFLRQFADAGLAVVAIAAIGRTKDSRGRSSYDGDGLNLASFRESSELEFGADDAYLLVPNAKKADEVILRHLKARNGETKDIPLAFDRRRQSFTGRSRGQGWKPSGNAVAYSPDDADAAGDDRGTFP